MARAADAAPSVVQQPQGFAGGVNIRDAVMLIGPNQARRMENGVLDEAGGFSKRLGCDSHGAFGAGADRGLSLYTFYRALNPPQMLMHTTAGELYYTNDPTVNPITWTLITTGLSTSVRMTFETFNNKVYMGNGVDSYASWDGTTYTTFASAPKGKYIRLWKDTMWVSGVSALPDRVYASNVGDAETFGVSSWIDIYKGDGDMVKALATDGSSLIVGKQSRSFVIDNPTTFANHVVDLDKGFESHHAVGVLDGSIYYLSRNGICQWQGGTTPSRVVSFLLSPLFDQQILAIDRLETSVAYTFENRIGFAIPEKGQTQPSVQIEYYPQLGKLTAFGSRLIGPWAFQRMPITYFMRWRYLGNDHLYGFANNSNVVARTFAPVGLDLGNTFTAIVESGGFDFQNPARFKYLRRARVQGRGRFDVQIRRDFQTAIAKTFIVDFSISQDLWQVADHWGTGTWGPDSVIKEKILNTDTYAQVFQLIFTDSETVIGFKSVEVGAREVVITAGEWAIYNVLLEGNAMGLRG